VHAQAIGRLAGFAVADVVGKDDEKLRDVERLTGPKSTSEKTGFKRE
jgi:hypothetical protein